MERFFKAVSITSVCFLLVVGTIVLLGGYQFRNNELVKCQIMNITDCENNTGSLLIGFDNYSQNVNMSQIFCEDSCCEYAMYHHSVLDCWVIRETDNQPKISLVMIPNVSIYLVSAFTLGIVILSISTLFYGLVIGMLIIEYRRKHYPSEELINPYVPITYEYADEQWD